MRLSCARVNSVQAIVISVKVRNQTESQPAEFTQLVSNRPLRDFGSYFCGGQVREVTEGTPHRIQATRDVVPEHDPRGHCAVETACVHYFVPEAARDRPPGVLVHGGGPSGSAWETTPDGRPGWLHGLLDVRRHVHVADLPERRRAGFTPAHMPGEPIPRSLGDPWSLLRIVPREGFAERRACAGQQFPAAAFEVLGRAFVTRWIGTPPRQVTTPAAVLDHLGACSLLCRSGGSEITLDAISAGRGCVGSVTAIEPSALPPAAADREAASFTIVQGDFLDGDPVWAGRAEAWSSRIAARPESGGAGLCCGTRQPGLRRVPAIC